MKYGFILLIAVLCLPILSYGQEESTSIGGYGEVEGVWATQLQVVNGKKTIVGDSNEFEVRRFVLFPMHQFNDWLSFYSELEIENTKIGADDILDNGDKLGEVEVEQVYIQQQVSKQFGLQEGVILAPTSWMNLHHEPPNWFGVDRPLFDRIVVPTTWRDIGVSAFGNIVQGLDYTVVFEGGLIGNQFSHMYGYAGGANGDVATAEGQATDPRTMALAGRLSYTGIPGLSANGSFYFSGTAQQDTAGETDAGIFNTPMLLLNFDAQYNYKGLYMKLEAAHSSIDGTKLNALYNYTINPETGAKEYSEANLVSNGTDGFYVEAAYNVMPFLFPNSTGMLFPFARYTSFNMNSSLSQQEQAFGTDSSLIETEISIGLQYKPIYNMKLEMDWIWDNNAAYDNPSVNYNGVTALRKFSMGIGYMF